MANLKQLAQQLKFSEGFLRGLTKGTARGKDDFIVLNAANGLRKVAEFAGYESEANAERAIKSDIYNLYMPNDDYAKKLYQLVSKFNGKTAEKLRRAADAISSNSFTEYRRIIKSDPIL
jgi:hypothetical protein